MRASAFEPVRSPLSAASRRTLQRMPSFIGPLQSPTHIRDAPTLHGGNVAAPRVRGTSFVGGKVLAADDRPIPSAYTNRLLLRLPIFYFHAKAVDVQAVVIHPEAFKTSVLRLIRRELPPRRGRPNDPRIDAAVRIGHSGLTARCIAAAIQRCESSGLALGFRSPSKRNVTNSMSAGGGATPKYLQSLRRSTMARS